MNIAFTKMVASGNDFIVLNNTDNTLKLDEAGLSGFTEKVCARRFGAGADGVLIVEASTKADFKMRIINPDGGEVSMCGNGVRCAAKYAQLQKITGDQMTVETLAGVLRAEIIGDEVKIKMTDPVDMRLSFTIPVNGEEEFLHFVNTGVEHAVSFVDDVESVNIVKRGSKIRHHEEFAPQGTNANFVQVMGENRIKVRTYERGVENETFACGTGATASAIIAGIVKNVHSPVDVLTKGGATLKIFFDIAESKVSEVFMQGEAAVIYDGRIDYV